jgi:thimet oligopeptidase
MSNTSKLLGTMTLLQLVACTGAESQLKTTGAAAAKPAETTAPAATPAVKPDAKPAPHPVLVTCDEHLTAVRDQRKLLVALGKPRHPPKTAEMVVEHYNQLMVHLQTAEAESSLFRSVHPDAATRDAAGECEARVAALVTELSLDRPLYEVFADLDTKGQPADTVRLVSKTLFDFRRAGVDKDEATRQRIEALQKELVQASQAFDKAIVSDVRTVFFTPAELDGLPQDWLDGHKPGRDGKIAVTTNYPDLVPVLNYATNDQTRKQLYIVNKQRAWPVNDGNLKQILAVRYELAKLLGYDSWAAFVTADKMIGSDKKAQSFLERVSKASDARMKQDYAELLAELQRDQPKATEVGDWQQAYLLGQVKKRKFSFDAQALRSYLHYTKVRDGLLALTGKLFGVTFKPNTTAKTWHPDVTVYDVYEGDKLHGVIYLDMHPREGKYKHAAQFTLRNGVKDIQLPEGVLVCNFPHPRDGGLMEHREVQTFFHEFGHLIHHTFGGHQRLARFSGVATEWDFVEAPSQIFEEWAKDYTTLSAFASNDKGEVIPKALVDKLVAAEEVGKGLWARHQLFYAALSLNMHSRDPKGLDHDALVADMMTKYSPYRLVADTHMQASFGHLNGYSAIYYTYMWSMVIAKDMFSAFEAGGIHSPKVAMHYRKTILEPGGSKDAAELVADFLGRPYDFGSFERWLNPAPAKGTGRPPAAGKDKK